MEILRRLLRLWSFFLLWLLTCVVIIWVGWRTYLLFDGIASERQALDAVRGLRAAGQRPAPMRWSKDLHGEHNKDYWCFAQDDLCFYSIARFRTLYPTYNDLDTDENLLAELDHEAGATAASFDRATSWEPLASYLRAVILPVLLVLGIGYGVWRRREESGVPV
jgi:hypothetical protein